LYCFCLEEHYKFKGYCGSSFVEDFFLKNMMGFKCWIKQGEAKFAV
jgi:hypothetical protein